MKDTTLELDIRRPLPFPSNAARRVLLEHVLEQLDFRSDAPKLCAEIYRTLAPGGVLRVVVPDAEAYIVAYLSRESSVWHSLGWDLAALPEDLYTPMHILNHIFHQEGEHLFAYDYETLKSLLLNSGFKKVEKRAYLQSIAPDLIVDQTVHAPYSLYVEAIKHNSEA